MTTPPRSLNATEVATIADELDRVLAGSKIQRVHGPGPGTLVLHCYGQGEKHALLVVLDGLLPRLHLARELPPNPDKPSEFVIRMRKAIEGARIRDVRALPDERIAELRLDVLVDGKPEERRLLVELLGRRSNVVLLGAEDRVQALLDASARRREGLSLGRAYEAPPSRDPVAPTETPFAWLEMAATSADASGTTPISDALEAHVSPADRTHRSSSERDRARTELRKRLKKERRLLENLERDLAKAGRGEELRRRGEILKAHLGTIAKKQRSITLEDHATGESFEVELPHDQTPVEVMQGLFKEAKKADRALPKLAARLGGVDERVKAMEAFDARLEEVVEAEDFEPLRADAIKLGLIPADSGPGKAAPKKKQQQIERKPYRTFESKDGIPILVGRTSRDNDELTFRVAKGNDLWLHVADWPGSHVVIRHVGEIPHETLLDAALLAAHFSKSPPGGKAEVSYTQRKHVTKFRGANAGQVQLAQRKSIRVRHDQDRLDRLMNVPGS